ncbi:Glutathione-regulated potassium-efflux system protein KefC [Rubripirellula tenax]|uniref:Glutathione-regulated potassium-efflux system protein KefC n=1 Tax=Rubripirellula tenax TaxID=2528015 RepID=A0A5C6FFL9_9BACT|nr:potassium channel family protein [Rubripirellula tenax]TWU60208.1 Glutathione-regulated potassium-efflux system protein KefC [Rubripirellula tenax]
MKKTYGIVLPREAHTTRPFEHRSRRTLRNGLTFFGATFLIATAGYVLAGWNWVDSIYMVTLTIFGVGYGEVHPIETVWMKWFTMGVICAGCSSLIYVIGGIVQMLTEGEIEEIMGIRQRSREIDSLMDHTIICGYGRVGQMLATELSLQGQQLLVLDCDSHRVDQAIADGFLALEGNAVEDEALQDAGIFRAATLATVLPDDAANVFITLTARDLCETICIIARAECPTTERKLIRGGATHVVMPAAIGAIRIAQLACNVDGGRENLPEDRYRMLNSQVRKDACKVILPSTTVGPETESSVQLDVAELAELASGLTKSMDKHATDRAAAK